MAKGIEILGNLRGKRGGIVYYRANGEQLSRPRVTPKNPQSAKQAVQRMVLATAAKMAAAYRPIVNHSFEGIPVGSRSTNHFRKLAMTRLRSFAAAYFGGGDGAPADFALKGAPVVGAAFGLQLSRGSLEFPEVTATADGSLSLAISGTVSEIIASQAAYEAALARLGLVPGDQLTFVAMAINPSIDVATFHYDSFDEVDHAQIVRFARVTFVSEIPAEFSGALVVEGAFNPALVEESKGILPTISSTASAMVFAPALPTGYSMMQGAIIRSQKQENGSFKYSTALMVSTEEAFDSNDAFPTYLSYMAGASQVEVGDELYLRHAVAAPFE